jgi:hypothetical protein
VSEGTKKRAQRSAAASSPPGSLAPPSACVWHVIGSPCLGGCTHCDPIMSCRRYELEDIAGESDSDKAARYWKYNTDRNSSVVGDLFAGQLMSVRRRPAPPLLLHVVSLASGSPMQLPCDEIEGRDAT